MVRKHNRHKGFTLLEVILAISLTGVLLLLLTTAIDLLLYRVDSSRSQVESAQLARSLLNLIADDLRAARYYAPASADESGESSGSTGDIGDDGEVSTVEFSSTVLGVYGTNKELRIDRAAAWRWERLLRDHDAASSAETVAADDMPQTVRYFLAEGDSLDAEGLASAGVPEEDSPARHAGLSRERVVTAARISQPEATDEESPLSEEDDAELLAPEVLDLEFAYFDGEAMVEKWNTAEQGGLPTAVEITLILAKEPPENTPSRSQEDLEEVRRDKDKGTEYRLLVRLPKVQTRDNVPGPRRVQPATGQIQ